MERFGLGLSFCDGAGGKGQHVALFPIGQDCVAVRFATDTAPARLTDDATLNCERRVAALLAIACQYVRPDGGDFLDAGCREGFDHSRGNHAVDGQLVLVDADGVQSRGEQGVVVGHLAGIHAATGERIYMAGMTSQLFVALQLFEQLGDGLENVVGDVTAARAGIGDELGFVEFLGDGERLLRREPVAAVGFLLQRSEVVKQGRFFGFLLTLYLRDTDFFVCFLDTLVKAVCRFAVLPLFLGGEFHHLFPFAFHGKVELPECFWRKASVFPIAGADHRQRGCLYTTDGVGAPTGGEAERLCAVDAHEPVSFTAGAGGKVEVVVVCSIAQVIESLADGLVGQRADPQAVERRVAVDVLVEIAEDKFTLASGIGRHDDALTPFKEPPDDVDLFEHTAVGSAAFLCLFCSGDKFERLGNDRQGVAVKAFYTVGFGQGELHKVPERPRHGIAVTREITFFPFAGVHHAGYLAGDARLFCNDCLHFVFFLLLMLFLDDGYCIGY